MAPILRLPQGARLGCSPTPCGWRIRNTGSARAGDKPRHYTGARSLHRMLSDTIWHLLLRPGYEGSERGEVREGDAADTVEVKDGAAEYAGTFTFRASGDASGTFHVNIRSAATALRDSSRNAIDVQSGRTAEVSIQAP